MDKNEFIRCDDLGLKCPKSRKKANRTFVASKLLKDEQKVHTDGVSKEAQVPACQDRSCVPATNSGEPISK